MHTKVEVAGQPVTTFSTSEADQQTPTQGVPTTPIVQPPVAPATPKKAAIRSLTVATHAQQKIPVTADVQPQTGRTVVTPH